MTSSSANSPYYFVMSGTSMATPVVSGAIADLLSAFPRLTPDQIKAKLMKTAYKTFPESSVAVDPQTGASYTIQYDVFTVGAGYLDLAAALADNSKFTGGALSPVARRDLLFGNVSLSFDLLSGWNLSGWSQKVGIRKRHCFWKQCDSVRQLRRLGKQSHARIQSRLGQPVSLG